MGNAGELTVYTTRWCGDCQFTKRLLRDWGVPYREVDIAEDDGARETVRRAAGGFLSVPTLVFPDGCVLVEPSRDELRAAIDHGCGAANGPAAAPSRAGA